LDEKTQKKLVARLKNHKCTIDDLSEVFKQEPNTVKDWLKELKDQSIPVSNRDEVFHINMLPDNGNVYIISEKDDVDRVLKFGVCSDIHFASSFHMPKTFIDTMNRLVDSGVTRVYVAGDIHDGINIYKGHLENLLTPSIEGQTDLSAEAFSKFPSLEFWGIAGNHDYSHTQANGSKPLSILEAKCENFKNLGDLRADVVYHGIKMRLLHGAGGRAYAKSYPIQTYLRDLFSGSERGEIEHMPHMIFLGHYHTVLSIKDHGIHIIQPGSFQDGDNEYCLRRGLTGPNGCFIVEIKYHDGVIDELQSTFVQPKVCREEKGSALKRTTKKY